MTIPRREPTHELTSGTTRHTFVGWMSEFPEEIPGMLANGINGLGRERRSGAVGTFYRIYPIPEGATGPNQGNPMEWIQAAGDGAGVTVEVKLRQSDGVFRQFVLGRVEAAGQEVSSRVMVGGDVLPVCAGEVLSADEAVGLFQYFYDHHAIAPGWHCRELPEYAEIPDMD